MDGDDSDRDGPGESAGGDAAAAAVAQFQRAALDAVSAARALLDAAESMIEEPAAIEAVVKTVNAFARQATDAVAGFAESAVRRSRPATPGAGDHDDEPDDDAYHGITVE